MKTETKLKFKQVELNSAPAWITGYGPQDYKVVQYGKGWFAFFKQSWQSCWGDSCFHDRLGESVQYKTRLEAQQAAQKHFETILES